MVKLRRQTAISKKKSRANGGLRTDPFDPFDPFETKERERAPQSGSERTFAAQLESQWRANVRSQRNFRANAANGGFHP
jgi:hypothetical protein